MEVTKKYKDLGPLIKFFNMRWNWPVSVRGNWEDILKKKEFPDPNISWPNSSQHASALAITDEKTFLINKSQSTKSKSSMFSKSSSSSPLSIRSQSPDFSDSLDNNFFSKKINKPNEKYSARDEKKRQEALNRSLEEISRELKEIDECFTVAEEILKKERERDQQLYDRERSRKNESICNESIDLENKKIKNSGKSPVFRINSVNYRKLRSPRLTRSKLYFKNGKIGCEEAERATSNIEVTHELVKHIIKQEMEKPLVPVENVNRILLTNILSDGTSSMDDISSHEIIEIVETEDVGLEITENTINVSEPNFLLNDEGPSSSAENNLDPDKHQFVTKRIHHLVNRFSDRTRKMRNQLSEPPTPSTSISSVSPSPALKITRNDTQIMNREKSDKKSKGSGCSFWICPIFCESSLKEKGLDPQGRFHISWLFIVSISFLYNCYVIPLRFSFPFQTPENTPKWLFMDYLADFIYLLDVLFIKHRIIYLYNGFWQTNRKDTRRNYMKKLQFKLDVLSLVPLDLFYLKFGTSAVYFRLPRLLKVQSCLEFFHLFDRVIASPHFVRVAKTLIQMLYMIHLTACAYYAYSVYEGIGTNRWVFSGKGHPYVRCFAFATKTATSIGKNPKPENQGELVFMTAAWLMGVFVFALLIGQIRDIIATATRQQNEYKQLVDETMEYMRSANLPQEIQRRVQMWFTFTWEQQRTLDESQIFDALPPNLKTDIAMAVHLQTLSKVQLFAECDEALLRELVSKLRSVTFIPGDFVCKKGEVGREMYIVKVGQVHVMGGLKNDEVLATLSEGSYFGEISLLSMNGADRNRRTADVRSQGFSNLFVLSKSDLNDALIYYPDAQNILKRRARSLMRKNAAREKADAKLTHKSKITPEPDVVIGNRKISTPPPKLLEAVMQTIALNSNVAKLVINESKEESNETLEIKMNEMNKSDYSNDKTDLLFSIQNALKVQNSLINLTDAEKSFYLNEATNDDSESEGNCDVTVHREMEEKENFDSK